MNRIFYFVPISILFLFVSSVTAQQATAAPPDDEVVKITTALIQVDAVVRAKDGTPVTDLKKENFQVLQDGKPQNITSVVYINPRALNLVNGKTKRDKAQPETPASGTRSGQGRIITFVLDDGNCYSSPESNIFMRDSMKRFVNEQMQPDDRVAIYRTKAGVSLLQMYTSNKDILRQKISKISTYAPGACATSNELDTNNRRSNSSPLDPPQGSSAFANLRDQQTIESLKVLDIVIDRLEGISQRKEIFFFSEGIPGERFSRSSDALLTLADKAARASVVIHTFSNKGLTNSSMINASDNVSSDDTEQLSSRRAAETSSLNTGLEYLANTTGGQFFRNRNSPDKALANILTTESGYYLIGYEPDGETFKGKEFHKIDISVDRADVVVSSRKGFFGHVNEAKKVVDRSADSPLYRAITSPLIENNIDFRFTVQYRSEAKTGGFVRGLAHIGGDDIQFKDEPDGRKKLMMDVIVVLLDEKAKAISDINRTYTLHLNADALPAVIKNGLDFCIDLPVKDKGLYSYRIAVRDGISGRMGAAGDFIEIPDAKKANFLISGLTATNSNNGRPNISPFTADGDFTFNATRATAASREYKHGENLVFTYQIFNPKSNGNAPSLTRQIRLFKDGKMLLDSGEKPLTPSQTDSPAIFTDTGNIKIAEQVQSGEYILQVIVRDKVADKMSDQSVDFEVIDN